LQMLLDEEYSPTAKKRSLAQQLVAYASLF